MRASFVLSEIGIGLRRNLTMTVAVVVTVAISLSLFGAGLLIRSQVDTMKDYWYDRVEVSVFLCGERSTAPTCAGRAVTEQERAQILADLEAMPEVAQVFYESKEEAFERFREQFEDSPDLVANVSPDALPESFRVKLDDATRFEVVAQEFRDRPGVEDVQDQKQLLDRFFRVLNGLQAAALFIAGVQLIAATLLIGNTIRVAAYSRRREIGIMRLVGASKFYIQLPFLLEGALAGLVGGFLASGVLAGIKRFFIDQQLKPVFTLTRFVGWDAVLAVVPVLLVTGVALASLASLVTLRRHLRV
ncbi:MAG: permease-like cell division protein FtsX [Actinomycetota bacterium]|nr:permease-like cell division protein FtsX [Actinomycetota bacterium]